MADIGGIWLMWGGCFLLLLRKLAECSNSDLGNWLLWGYFLDEET
jgi:hypothetical protein